MKALTVNLVVMVGFLFALNICYAQSLTDYFSKGLEYATTGDFEEAQKAFRKVLEMETYPAGIETIKRYLQITDDVLREKINKETGVYLFKGVVSSRMYMLDQAITEWKKAAELNPNYIMTYKMLAGVYIMNNKYDEAIVMLKKAIEIDSTDAEANFKLASVYYFNKQYKLAIEHGEKAKELGLKDPELFNLLQRLEPYRK